jgi:hypothetical protein
MDISSATSPGPGPQWTPAVPVKPAQSVLPAAPADAETAASAATASGTDSSAEPPSGIQSVTYGFLGIDPPDGQPAAQDSDYRAGQWAGAALKVGGVIALLA